MLKLIISREFILLIVIVFALFGVMATIGTNEEVFSVSAPGEEASEEDPGDEFIRISRVEYHDLLDIMESVERLRDARRASSDEPKMWVPELHLKPFTGRSDSSVIKEFLSRLESAKLARGMPDLKFLERFVPNFLQGEPFRWFQFHYVKRDWDSFARDFTERYSNQSVQEEIEERLFSCVMDKEQSVTAFIDNVQELNDRLNVPISQNDLVKLIRRNMNPLLRARLVLKPGSSMSEFVSECQRAERVWAAADRFMGRNFSQVNDSGQGRNSSGMSGQREIRCFRCQEVGHYARSCRNNQQSSGSPVTEN